MTPPGMSPPTASGGDVGLHAVDPAQEVAWERLEDQLGWYDRKAAWNQRWYKRLKLLELVLAASLPVMAAVGVAGWGLGAAGAVIVVMEGAQGLYRFHEHWITYRATAEALKHERYLYLAASGPYARAKRPAALLADRVESLVSQEHARWASSEESGRAQERAAT